MDGEVIFFLILFSVLVGVWANNRGRNGLIWGLFATILSPIIAAIILAVIPNEKEEEEKRVDRRLEKYKHIKQENEKVRQITSSDFILSVESLRKLHEKKILSNLEYKTKKTKLINSLSNKILVEGKDDFLAGIIPLMDENILDKNDLLAVKTKISY